MITVNVGENVINLFDSIKSLPNSRKLLADQCALWEDGIGTGLNKIRQNLMSAKSELLQKGSESNIASFIENADIGISALQYGEDFKLKEFICFVHSYQNGKNKIVVLGSLKIDDLDKYCLKINELGVSIGDIEETLETVKKKPEES